MIFFEGFTYQNIQHIQETEQDPLDHLQEWSKQDTSNFIVDPLNRIQFLNLTAFLRF